VNQIESVLSEFVADVQTRGTSQAGSLARLKSHIHGEKIAGGFR
jgi:hypothetical protein